MTYWLVFITLANGMLNTESVPARSMSDCADKLKIAAPYYPSNAILLCIAILPDRRKPQ